MKKILALTLITLAGLSFFGGCERNDYQHPMYRSK